jgi:hypothetical protein
MNTIYWSQPKEGGKIGNKQFYIKGNSLHVGEKAYEFEIDGDLNLQKIIDSKDEIMNLVTKDKDGNEVVENMFHSVNNSLINKKDIPYEIVEVVDGKIVIDKNKKFKNYLEYLLSNKNGRTPVVYTNIVEYNKDKPQLANSYLSYVRPKEEVIIPPKPAETTETTEEPLGFTNIKPNTKFSITRKMNKNVLLELEIFYDGKLFKIEKAIRLSDDVDRTKDLTDNGVLNSIENELLEEINKLTEFRKEIKTFENALQLKLKNGEMPSVEENESLKSLKNTYLELYKILSNTYFNIKYVNNKDTSNIKSDIEKLIIMGKIPFVDETTNAKC